MPGPQGERTDSSPHELALATVIQRPALPAPPCRSFNRAADFLNEVLNGCFEGLDLADAVSRM